MNQEQMRAAFEAWLNPGNHAGNVSAWVAPGRYEKETHQAMWLGWCGACAWAAREAAVAAIFAGPSPEEWRALDAARAEFYKG